MTKFNDLTLDELNKKYNKKSFLNLKILDVLFGVFVFFAFCYLLFCLTFVQAQVIGFSMQPTFNSNLQLGDDPKTSIYKDVVYANRFSKGTNGDIVLIQMENEIIIKRLIATQGQTLTLKLDEDDGFYYYYLDGQKIQEDYIDGYRSSMNQNYFNRFCLADSTIEIITPNKEATFIIPTDKFFALGDNRHLSQDSTVHGAFDNTQILGAVSFFYEYNQTFLGFVWQKICSVF